MDETEPLEWYEHLALVVVVGYSAAAIPAFYIGLPLALAILSGKMSG